MTSPSKPDNRIVPCMTCGYHYRSLSGRMVATERGWQCTDLFRCNGNLARQAWYRRGR